MSASETFLISSVSHVCRILIILDLEVLKDLGETEKIGEPKPLEVKAEEEPQPTTISSNGFYGSKIQGETSQQSSRAPAARGAPSSAHAAIYPIAAISPYSNKWTIKARCTSKSNVKTWHNKNGEGKLFSVNLLDDSGEIRATGFNDQCDMLYNLFQEGSVYYISSPCRVQIAKKQFTNLNNDYELTFERETIVEKVGSRVHRTSCINGLLWFRRRTRTMFLRFASISPLSAICKLWRKTQPLM